MVYSTPAPGRQGSQHTLEPGLAPSNIRAMLAQPSLERHASPNNSGQQARQRPTGLNECVLSFAVTSFDCLSSLPFSSSESFRTAPGSSCKSRPRVMEGPMRFRHAAKSACDTRCWSPCCSASMHSQSVRALPIPQVLKHAQVFPAAEVLQSSYEHVSGGDQRHVG